MSECDLDYFFEVPEGEVAPYEEQIHGHRHLAGLVGRISVEAKRVRSATGDLVLRFVQRKEDDGLESDILRTNEFGKE